MYIIEFRRRQIGLRLVMVSIVVFALLVGQDATASNETSSNWNSTLPALSLSSVKVEATSLPQAWQIVSRQHLVRSILVVSQSSPVQGAFSLDKKELTVGQLMDATVASYPDYRWSQDPKTSVLWIYPKEIAYENLLSATIEVEAEQLSVPMQTGILEELFSIDALGLRAGPLRTSAIGFKNTFDYPVNVPAGSLSIRELLNICAEQNISKSFFIELLAGVETIITPVNLVSDKLNSPPEGAVLWWHLEIGETHNGMGPSKEDLLNALSGSDGRRRMAARSYLETVIWQVPFEGWVSGIADQEEAIWYSLALLDILFRVDLGSAVNGVIINRLKMESTTNFYDEGPPFLALLAALEIARLGRDSSILRRVEMRNDLNFDKSSNAELISEMARIVRRSEQMRSLMEKSELPSRLGVSPVTIGLTSRNLVVAEPTHGPEE